MEANESQPRDILIVANQTAGGEHLKREVRSRIASGPCRFMLLVPATPPTAHATWTEEEAAVLAEERMQKALAGLQEVGTTVDGVVGDVSPMDAIEDMLRSKHFDEIILSTLPPGVSKWVKQDLPHRVRRRFDIPLTHVIGEAEGE